MYGLHPKSSSSNLLFRHYQSLLQQQGSILILTQKSDLRVTSFHYALDMVHAFVILLSSYDFIPQGWLEGDAQQ
jgi:hypothetical protein